MVSMLFAVVYWYSVDSMHQMMVSVRKVHVHDDYVHAGKCTRWANKTQRLHMQAYPFLLTNEQDNARTKIRNQKRTFFTL